MRTLLPLAVLLALTGCAPGMYVLGALPAAVAGMASPIRDGGMPGGNPYPVSYGRIADVPGRAQLPADGPLWSLTPAAPRAACAAQPAWLSPPPWRAAPNREHPRDPTAAVYGCAPAL
ncbi:hypothetical protein [Azospirillum sp. TSO22-1]|uniref:hypothetical protein n=1 Tax=Azospirillum sp. TSO22-1 TaxID=716789 RepID=UPI000D618C2A|nr:hypothetical protein [Azospirillum sp. TSO22-1]PWC36913.1 hypothetical protein TSO221_28335 [Azospirillum sp. TSO22-1]